MKPSVRASSVEGLRRELKDLRRQVMDLKREQPWRFDTPETDSASAGVVSGSGTILDTSTIAEVSHGMTTAPGVVVATPRGSVEPLAVPSRSTTTFTVERSGSTGDLSFDWIATPAAEAPAPVVPGFLGHEHVYAGSGTITVAKPLEAVDGSLLIAVGAKLDADFGVPAGWNLVDSLVSTYTTASQRLHVWSRTAAPSDPTSWSWTSSDSRSAQVVIFAYEASAVNAIQMASEEGGNSLPVIAPSVTPGAAPGRLLYIGTTFGNSGTWTVPPGMDRRFIRSPAGSGSTAVLVCDETYATTDATGTRTATLSATSNRKIAAALTIS